MQWTSGWKKNDSTINVYLSAQQSNGSWPDINYTSNPDYTHLSRIFTLAEGYSSDSSTHHLDPTTYSSILKGLRYWFSATRTNSNWYVNVITFPDQYGQVMILMRYAPTDLPSTLKDTLLNHMNIGAANNGNTQSGSNETDVAVHYIYRACLTNNTLVMDTAFNHAFQPIYYTTGDGITYDNCYLAHAGQLAIASYGWSLLSDEFSIAPWLTGTLYALANSKFNILIGFYKDTYLKTGRHGYGDYSVQGRGISRGSGINHPKKSGGESTTFLGTARLVAPSYNAIWDSVANGTYQQKPLHTHYWRSDYAMHLRPGYTFTVHTVSTRTSRTEQGNGENLLGKFLPDGATDIQRWGGEYQNIYPIWNWAKIPGVTSRNFSTDAGSTISGSWGSPGSDIFVGGVSDTLYGASVYNMNYNGVAAKKSWFYFDNEVVCLGAGITSTQAENIVTSVNQCWLYGGITLNNGGTVSTIDSAANTATQYTSPQWVMQDSVGYFFPAGGNLTVSNKVQTGSWSRINSGESTTALSGRVFSMWFDHGASPTNAKYAYVVVPGLGSATDMQNYNASNIRVVANTDSVQAIRHLGLDMMDIVFYKAGTLTDSTISITVDKPCILELKNLHSSQIKLHISDPAQLYNTIACTFVLPGISGSKSLNAVLARGSYTGQTATYVINSSTQFIPFNPSIAVADAYVRDGTYASTNYGTSITLVVKNDGTGYARQLYLKFDARYLAKYFNTAKLQLYCTYGNTAANTTQWALYKVNNCSWTETGITWNNKPAAATLISTTPGQTTAGFVSWDIASALTNLPADSLLTLQLVSTAASGNTDASFASKEYPDTSKSPRLIVSKLAIVPGNIYKIRTALNGTSNLDVTGSATADGTKVQLNADNSNSSELWKITDVGGGFYKLEPQNAIGKVMDVSGAGTANGTQVDIWDYLNVTQEKWQINNVGANYFELRPSHDLNKVLDVAGGSTANGAKIQIWDPLGLTEQKWLFEKMIAPVTAIQAGAIYEIKTAVNGTSNLDVTGGATANGTKVQLYTDNNSNSQRWKVIDVGGGFYQLQPQNGVNKAMDASGAGTANGTQVDIWDYVNVAQEKWQINNLGGYYFELRPSYALNKVLDLSGGSTANGAKIQIWEPLGLTEQKWIFDLITAADGTTSNLAQTYISAVPMEQPLQQTAGLKVYPNPAHSICTITSDNRINQIAVYNSSSHVVKIVGQINANQYQMNMTGWDNGVYIFIITGDKLKESRRVIKLE
ncbi:MAG: polysaccharide lyase 8 family protein [Mucilaginibacter sp.]|nr:polysaccharide lyase 8 family protein [Mucilaginibacter sp.]